MQIISNSHFLISMQAEDLFQTTAAYIHKKLENAQAPRYMLELLMVLRACGTKALEVVHAFWRKYDPTKLIVTKAVDVRKAVQFCDVCHSTDFAYDLKSADLICCSCGRCTYNSTIGYTYGRMPYEEAEHFQLHKINKYKRMTNLKTILRNLQAYASPMNDELMLFAEKYRGSALTLQEVRVLMKRHKLGKFYSKLHMITAMLSSAYTPLRLSQRDTILIMGAFRTKVRQFEFNNVVGRKNFVSYHYALKQICTELNLLHVLPHLLPLKCSNTYVVQSRIWRSLCK